MLRLFRSLFLFCSRLMVALSCRRGSLPFRARPPALDPSGRLGVRARSPPPPDPSGLFGGGAFGVGCLLCHAAEATYAARLVRSATMDGCHASRGVFVGLCSHRRTWQPSHCLVLVLCGAFGQNWPSWARSRPMSAKLGPTSANVAQHSVNKCSKLANADQNTTKSGRYLPNFVPTFGPTRLAIWPHRRFRRRGKVGAHPSVPDARQDRGSAGHSHSVVLS